ncbi:hypothetical protein HX004_02710 [Myroides sp. 1354]|uniref:hypothetical protein n=1 Tax=unclassified Myroides TaxID=2642485 RepID=UPI0025749088|nr:MULTISPECIES: hypothetical protein [unclassified Myroides]MDM1043249.1 hypothetical protein [Myroides sp. R163-1]MDM1054698.1 hypothetical protein [Myroides sp. 1354]MDM1067995.1 hypothetical protein [Myroides sp. 1372]
MKKAIGIASFIALIATACTQQQSTQNLESLDKKSAREVTLKTITSGDSIYHITAQTIWVNGKMVQQKVDTITTAKNFSDWGDNQPTSLEKIPIYVTVE